MDWTGCRSHLPEAFVDGVQIVLDDGWDDARMKGCAVLPTVLRGIGWFMNVLSKCLMKNDEAPVDRRHNNSHGISLARALCGRAWWMACLCPLSWCEPAL
jgi:hypothetical protein